MNEKAEKLSGSMVVPAIAVRPLCPADVGRVAISGGSICFAIENKEAPSSLGLVVYARDKFVLREYTGAALAVLMGRLEFHPDLRGTINAAAPEFYSSDLFIGGGDPFLVVQQPTSDKPHAFSMLNAKTATLSSQIPTQLYSFKYWSLGVRNADGSSLTTLLSVDNEQVGSANTRALQRGALHGR